MENIDPPDPLPVPLPVGRSEGVLPWLRAHGLSPRSFIPISQSMFSAAFKDPFLFYLTYILGISPAFRVSPKALSRGSWAHVRLEYLDSPSSEVPTLMNARLADRIAEINSIGDAWGIPRSSIDQNIDYETKNCRLAWSWFDALASIPIPTSATGLQRPMTFVDYLHDPAFLCLGRELKVRLRFTHHSQDVLITGILDRLILNTVTNQLWIFDLKTCDSFPDRRLRTCRFEFQTQKYLFILLHLLRGGYLSAFPINSDTTIGGMCHMAMQKPSIIYDRRVDRPFKWNEHVLKSGPRKGQIDLRKEYLSEEPSMDLFIERCIRWYKAEGEYIDLAADRALHCPVDFSFTPCSVALDDDGMQDYYSRLDHILSLTSKWDQPPSEFTRNPYSLSHREDNEHLAGFYFADPVHWPSLMSKFQLVQWFRDSDLNQSAQSGIFQ